MQLKFKAQVVSCAIDLIPNKTLSLYENNSEKATLS